MIALKLGCLFSAGIKWIRDLLSGRFILHKGQGMKNSLDDQDRRVKWNRFCRLVEVQRIGPAV
ncbi:MAG: hypothetical protein B6D70_11420 [gamma proteobacterium symbiont of Stewartia floridana]|nr:MAG: hypothetical protein B6D76_17765 [gamma proteobacterium symbiont of Stewartia floridana]RLW59812.1 MAG: hypothetical protein B6D70_11420 [gamma proteobacterium symbiont of Stewartia floridana]RLW66073.1 MAG: hypothetical protein B6D73_04675 [gamma proteobacterium symbiont of Stewartia floridana]